MIIHIQVIIEIDTLFWRKLISLG